VTVVEPVITVGMVVRSGREPHQRNIDSVNHQLGPDDVLLLATVEGNDSLAVVRNRILGEADSEVVAFISEDGLPVEEWLSSVRSAFLDPGIDAIAGSVGPPVPRKDRNVRPGGRLRWTGHIVSDYAVEEQAVTSLATGDRPHEDVEFFTRLIKTGGRMLYVPGARFLPEERHSALRNGGSPEETLELEVQHSRSMAAIFARHEAWALLIMVASHLLITLIEVFSSRLPRIAPVRIARAMMDGVHAGVRPVTSPFGEAGKRKR